MDPLQKRYLMADCAQLVANSLAYSFYLPTFCCSLRNLFTTLRNVYHRVLLVSVGLVLFVLITTQFILSLSRLWTHALMSRIDHNVRIPSAALSFPCFLAGVWLFIACVWLADMAFMFRLYHTWGKSYKIILFPTACILTSPICMLIFSFRNTTLSSRYLFNMNLITPLTSFLANLYITSMISYKVWRTNRTMSVWKKSGINSVIVTILESAGVYTGCSFLTMFMVFTLLDLNASEVLSSSIGMSYSLMIILVARGRSRDIRYTSMSVGHEGNPMTT